jgi:hypothetical protein
MTHKEILDKYKTHASNLIYEDAALKAMEEAVAISEAKMINEYGKTNESFRAELAAKDKEIAEVKEENRKLHFMIQNGLGYEDFINR